MGLGNIKLKIIDQKDSEILSGLFVCKECNSEYKIKNGVPIFVNLWQEKDKEKITSSRFGWQWTHFSNFDIDIETKKFLEWIYPTDKDFFRNKIILDAGCGMGRHCIIAQHLGAEEVIGIDLGSSVFPAYENTKKYTNIHIIQADIYNLPFKEESFDFIYSIGVIHHLPDPQKGFVNLLKYLRQKGKINIFVYGRENNGWIIYFVNPIRKYITSKIQLKLLLYISLIPTLILYITTKFIYKPINKVFPNLYIL